MSQFFQKVTTGTLPPTVLLQVTADDGTTAAPAANNLNLYSADTSANDDDGIRTIASGSTWTVQLTNRVTGAVTTTDDTPTTLISLSLGGTPGTYLVQGDITAYDVTDAAGASYTFVGAAVTDGAVGTEISVESKDVFEQAAMAASDFNLGVSVNSAFIEVIGIVGKTINWSCLFTYRFVG